VVTYEDEEITHNYEVTLTMTPSSLSGTIAGQKNEIVKEVGIFAGAQLSWFVPSIVVKSDGVDFTVGLSGSADDMILKLGNCDEILELQANIAQLDGLSSVVITRVETSDLSGLDCSSSGEAGAATESDSSTDEETIFGNVQTAHVVYALFGVVIALALGICVWCYSQRDKKEASNELGMEMPSVQSRVTMGGDLYGGQARQQYNVNPVYAHPGGQEPQLVQYMYTTRSAYETTRGPRVIEGIAPVQQQKRAPQAGGMQIEEEIPVRDKRSPRQSQQAEVRQQQHRLSEGVYSSTTAKRTKGVSEALEQQWSTPDGPTPDGSETVLAPSSKQQGGTVPPESDSDDILTI